MKKQGKITSNEELTKNKFKAVVQTKLVTEIYIFLFFFADIYIVYM